MASKLNAVWALDLGNYSLKALRLTDAHGVVEVVGFEHIQHAKVLTGRGVKPAERDELIALSLREFVNRNDVSKDDVIVSVPGHDSFARFVNLPPVDAKRIPEIVKFEAAQQIPFDIDDVQWDWQLMTQAGSAKNRVGIFAIKNDIVNSALAHFSREDIQVHYVQMSPMALYNYLLYDRPDLCRSDNQAVVILNIGAENTDLIVCTRSTVWQRCVPMGGNSFTRAIADTFKLDFQKAEKLKRNVSMSKYARQILQAMKPVFTDLVSEIQRSLGFYSNSNPNTKLLKVVALGGGTKMRGLLTYLQQALQMQIERPDSFKKLSIGSNISEAKFHENVCDFGVVYGLAVQGLGLGRIENNLLPRSIARSMAWAAKAKYFIVAACLLLAVAIMSLARTNMDKMNYAKKEGVRREIKQVTVTVQEVIAKLSDQEKLGKASQAIIQKEFNLFNYRDMIPRLHETIISALPNAKNNPEQAELYRAFAQGRLEEVKKVLRKDRKQIFVTSMSVQFADDIGAAPLGSVNLVQRSRSGTSSGSPRSRRSGAWAGARRPYAPPTRPTGASKQAGSGQQEEIEEGPGFVVTIAGYSTQEEILELLDPAGVQDDPNQWGVVTRLQHLDAIVDGNSPFKLYKKAAEGQHFELTTGEVDLALPMPAGIGVESDRFEDISDSATPDENEKVLVDPMTNEIINKVAQLDENRVEIRDRVGRIKYQVNDHWFVLKAKFLWTEASIKGAPIE